MIESAADRAAMLSADGFGERADLTGGGSISGIFTPAAALMLGDPGARDVAPVFLVQEAEAPPIKTTLTLRSALWRVVDSQPDGTGLTRLILEKG